MSSKTQHTPGPWVTDGSRVYRQQNPGGCRTFVAEVLHDPCFAQQKANARLIVAAPDLLEALHRIEYVLCKVTGGEAAPDDVDGLLVDAKNDARAAIAKATEVKP